MKTKKIKTVLTSVAIALTFYACSESASEVCREECYEIILVENGNRHCGGAPLTCTFNFKVTFKNECNGELVRKTTTFRPLNQKPKVGDTVCSFLGYR